MPTSRPKPPAHAKAADTSQAVDAFMAQLNHPFKSGLETIRSLMLSADRSIAEGIKWNAPSFRTTEYFATTNLRGKTGLRIIFHLGAKVRELPPNGIAIDDPKGLLKWLGKDRAMIEFNGTSELDANKAALRALVRQWITHV